MAKNTQKAEIFLELPEDFIDRLNEAVAEEFLVAPGKWGVSLSEEEEEEVIVNSFEQLKSKVSRVSLIDWNLTRTIHIKMKEDKGKIAGRSVSYPTDNSYDNNLIFFLKGDGLRVEDELLDNFIRGEDLRDFYMDKLEKWMRTAVFYGVGSYSGM